MKQNATIRQVSIDKIVIGRYFLCSFLLLTAVVLLTACAVPEWLLESGVESAAPPEAYPLIATVAATGTPIDAVETPVPADAGIPGSQPAEEVCVDAASGSALGYDEALLIAADSACAAEGELLPDHFCNQAAGAWLIGLSAEREGCSPVCIVNVTDLTAAVDWRCAEEAIPAPETAEPQPQPTSGASPTPTDSAMTFKEWQGIIYRQPAGSLVEYRFLRDDGQWFDISTRQDNLRPLFTEAAWSGTKVLLSGQETAVPGVLNVQRLVELPVKSRQPRNLTPFAMPSVSSRLPADEGGAYQAWSAVDGLLSEPWCEGTRGSGIGEWLQLDFTAPVDITEIRLANGFQSGDFLYVLNSRPQAVSIVADGEWIDEWVLADQRDWQSYTLGGDVTPGITATSLRLVIEDIIEGWEFDDTCIAEVEVWGRPR